MPTFHLVFTITLNDGVILTHVYDGLGHLISRSASDRSIDERFTLDMEYK